MKALTELAAEANKYHAEVESQDRTALEAAWNAGTALNAAKEQVGHGEWKPWVEANFEGSYRTAAVYMRLASNMQTSALLAKFGSIDAALKSLQKPRPKDKPTPTAPKPHDRHDEVIELSEQGLSMKDIAKDTGIGARQVRHIVDRHHVEQIAKADVETIELDWESLPEKAREREAVMRRIIRKEIEREIEPRVQEAVSRRLDAASTNLREMRDQSLRVLRGRKGIFTKAGYNAIKSCLHPDSRLAVSDEKLAKAFRAFNEAEILLLDETDSPTLASTLPSYEELLKRRAAQK